MSEANTFVTPLDALRDGPEVSIEAVKWRKGRRHRVVLHLRWQPLMGEWWLRRYEEFPWPEGS